jgi:membrane carboxypeptidase/penicillin-binding protein
MFPQQYQLCVDASKCPERKIKEWIVAIQIEKRFTKRKSHALREPDQSRHGAYGVEAASHPISTRRRRT